MKSQINFMDMEKIAAIVVTYNRLQLLKESIQALRNQTRKADLIIVVNNGSSDGTKEYLDAQGDLHVIHQENLGGSGGFYSGSKYAYDQGYDWVWMLDDDGLPDPNELEELIKVAQKYQKKVINALVVSKTDPSRLVFNHRYKPTDFTSDITDKVFAPFNGTFIHRSVMDKIGFIKKEMFIWGDEQEYYLRIKKAGYVPYTAVKAIHHHPNMQGNIVYLLPFIKKGTLNIKPSHLSHYFYRNQGYIYHNYFGFFPTLKFVLYHTIYFTFTGNFTELKKFFKYFSRGIKNDYNS